MKCLCRVLLAVGVALVLSALPGTAMATEIFSDDFEDGTLDTSLWNPVLTTFCFDPGPPKGTIEETGGKLTLITYEDPHANTWVDAAYVNSKVNLKTGSRVQVEFVLSALLEYEVIWSGGQIRVDVSDRVDMPIIQDCRPAGENVEGTVNIVAVGVPEDLSIPEIYVLCLNPYLEEATLYRNGVPVEGCVDVDLSGLESWYVRFYVDTAVSAGSSSDRIHTKLWIDSVSAWTTEDPSAVEHTSWGSIKGLYR